MEAKAVNLTTEYLENKHRLSISDHDGKHYTFTLTAGQIMVLAQQAIAQIWSYYKLVPRD